MDDCYIRLGHMLWTTVPRNLTTFGEHLNLYHSFSFSLNARGVATRAGAMTITLFAPGFNQKMTLMITICSNAFYGEDDVMHGE